MHKYLLPLVCAVLLAGCSKKDDPAPKPQPEPKKDFTVGYFFNNQNDSRLQTVWLQTLTFYPNKNGPGNNRLQVYDNTYPDITPSQRIAHVFTEAHMEKTLYPGCITYMKVILMFRTPVYTPYPAATPPANGHRFRVFELPPDTVTEAANCTREFNWPTDTLKYRELRYY